MPHRAQEIVTRTAADPIELPALEFCLRIAEQGLEHGAAADDAEDRAVARRRIVGADVSRESPREDGHEQDDIYQKHAVKEAQTHPCLEVVANKEGWRQGHLQGGVRQRVFQ